MRINVIILKLKRYLILKKPISKRIHPAKNYFLFRKMIKIWKLSKLRFLLKVLLNACYTIYFFISNLLRQLKSFLSKGSLQKFNSTSVDGKIVSNRLTALFWRCTTSLALTSTGHKDDNRLAAVWWRRSDFAVVDQVSQESLAEQELI